MQELKQWHLEKRITRTLNSLKKNGFNTLYASNRKEATKKILTLIPPNSLVGVGGSVTVRELGLIEALQRRGNRLAQHWQKGLSFDEIIAIERQQLTSEVFLTSSNAITESGQLVNVDGGGNRVAAMIFGPTKVIVIVGVNKIVKDIDAGLERIKRVAAPLNAKRLNLPTPCTVTGVCSDCDISERICNITTIIHRKSEETDITIVLVGETLGF
jgi:L-lactate utilization protein LutB